MKTVKKTISEEESNKIGEIIKKAIRYADKVNKRKMQASR